jgi:calcineurin-like phosphoesterase family protein
MLKIKLDIGQKIFITSDTHYGHKNICAGVTEWDGIRSKGKTRDFETLEEMNEAIIQRINSDVGQDDILIHLGDWSFGGFDNIEIFRNRIICKNIHLITGNHDHHIVRNRNNVRSLFSSVHEFYAQLEVELMKSTFVKKSSKKVRLEAILSHFPICSWDDMSRGKMHLFGHVHLPPHLKFMPGKSMDVGVDGNDLYPYDLFKVDKMMQSKPIKTSIIPQDHHSEEVK